MLTTAFSRHVVEQFVASGGFVLAVGHGEASWDEQLPLPDSATTALVDEQARVVVPSSNVVFLDDNGTVSQTPTPRVELTARISGDGVLGPLREVGWFAGATEAPDSGTLFVYRTHPRLDVTPAIQITRTIRIDLAGGPRRGDEARYLANTRTEELHDLNNLTTNCQVEEIRMDHRHGFDSVDEALAMGYDRCAYCFGRDLSTR